MAIFPRSDEIRHIQGHMAVDHNPNTQEQWLEGHEFKANLVYITRSRPAELHGKTVAKIRTLSFFMLGMLCKE